MKYAPKETFQKPLVSVDIIIFTVVDAALKVLLTQRPDRAGEPFPNYYCLPGGYVDIDKDMTLHDTALRKLREKTGYDAPYVEQLATWGSAERDPRGWSVTQAYFALLPAEVQAEQMWLQADEACATALAFDHNDILQTALKRLRSKVEYTSLPAFLLAEPFTLPQLQKTYEIVLARKLDKSAFRKRTLDADLLVEVGQMQGDFGRVAMGYRLKQRESAVTFPRPFKSGE